MNNPTDVGVVKEKIENGKVKAKKERGSKKEKATSVETERQRISADKEKFLAWMREQGKEVTSTAVRDAFGFKNRAPARRLMRSLEKAGKVQTIENGDGNGKRKQFRYRVV